MARSELDRLIEDAQAETQDLAGESAAPSSPEGPTSAQSPNDQAASPTGETQNPQGSGKAGDEESADPTQLAQGKGKSGQDSGEQTADAQSSPSSPSGEGEPGDAKSSKDQPGTPANPNATASSGTPSESGAPSGQPGQGNGQPRSQPSGTPSSPSTPSESRGSSNNTAVSDSPSASPPGPSSPSSGQQRTAQAGGNSRSTGGGGGFFFDAPTEQEASGPIAGNGYNDWADRLRTVSELLEEPALRNDAARVLDEARAMRIESRRNNEPPQVNHLQNRITRPLVELRDRVIEELARQNADDPTVPIDRDPVPPEYQDLVRRYYTELGRGR